MRDSARRADELPIRLAHRVKELDELPHNLNKMPSIEKVKKWYAESFEVRLLPSPSGSLAWRSPSLSRATPQELVNFPRPVLPTALQEALIKAAQEAAQSLPDATPNPSLPEHMKQQHAGKALSGGRPKTPLQHRSALVCEDLVAAVLKADDLSVGRQLLLRSGLEYQMAAGGARLQREVHKAALEHQAAARPRCDDNGPGNSRVQTREQVDPDRPVHADFPRPLLHVPDWCAPSRPFPAATKGC